MGVKDKLLIYYIINPFIVDNYSNGQILHKYIFQNIEAYINQKGYLYKYLST